MMNKNELFLELRPKFDQTAISDDDLMNKVQIAVEINRLKEQKNALILGHNYMEPVLFHSIPDFVGDSLELSRKAASTDKDVIVFCGVKFMAETAKILNPGKTVLVPSLEAGCSLAESITAEDVRAIKAQFPGVPVVTYVNTYADVKAESDICCTSSNAAKVVESLHADTVIFLPDEFLAGNVARQTGKHIIFPNIKGETKQSPEIEFVDIKGSLIGWHGRCEVHEQFTLEDITQTREAYPGVEILAHPECNPQVAQAADFCGGTTAMVRYVEQSSAPYFLLLTESAMGDNIAAVNPSKNILQTCRIRCPHMERITLENTRLSLQNNQYEIQVPEEIASKARQAVERMLAIG